MASVQVDSPEVEEVSSHVEDKTNKGICEPENIGKEEHHDYVEEEEDPEDLDNVSPDHEKGEKVDEDEEELLTGSQIVDEGEKPTGGIVFSDEEEEEDDDHVMDDVSNISMLI